MDLFDRIIFQKNNGDSTNYDRVFTDLHSMIHSPTDKFIYDHMEITWTYFRSVDFYKDIILENDDRIYFYLRNQSLTFEAIFDGFIRDRSWALPDSNVVMSSIYVFGNLFPGLEDMQSRPVIIRSNCPFPNINLKKLNYYFRRTLENYKLRTKAIYEWKLVNFYKDGNGWQKIVEKNRSLKRNGA